MHATACHCRPGTSWREERAPTSPGGTNPNTGIRQTCAASRSEAFILSSSSTGSPLEQVGAAHLLTAPCLSVDWLEIPHRWCTGRHADRCYIICPRRCFPPSIVLTPLEPPRNGHGRDTGRRRDLADRLGEGWSGLAGDRARQSGDA
jgi:NAD-dependent dihydropyrimidine dehydrogenase PreA subunit